VSFFEFEEVTTDWFSAAIIPYPACAEAFGCMLWTTDLNLLLEALFSSI
jgi:hypothetical protein